MVEVAVIVIGDPYYYYSLGAQPQGDLNSTCGSHGHSHHRRVAVLVEHRVERKKYGIILVNYFLAPSDLCHQLISINQPP